MNKVFMLICLGVVIHLGATSTCRAQNKWDVNLLFGFGSDNNLGDHGLQLGFGTTYALTKRLNLTSRLSTFQMLGTNEDWSQSIVPERENRSLSTLNLDLGVMYSYFKRPKFSSSIQLGPTFRIGRQLWPMVIEVIPVGDPWLPSGGNLTHYRYVRIRDAGLFVNNQMQFKVSDKVDLLFEIQSGHQVITNSFSAGFLSYAGLATGVNIKL